MIDQKVHAQRNAIELFYFAYRAFTAFPDQILEQQGLSRVHHRILYFVCRHPGLSINNLLRILGVSKQALNAPLRQLTEKQLIGVQGAEHDRRVKQLFLTPAGQALEALLTGTQESFLRSVFAETGPHSEESWLAVMEVMSGKLK